MEKLKAFLSYTIEYLKYFLTSKKAARIYNIFVFILIFYLISHWLYKNANLGLNAYNNFSIYGSLDFATSNQAVWNTIKGRLFQANDRTSIESILAHRNFNIISCHFTIIHLLIALFYLILSHPVSFIISQSLFVSMSGLGLYLVAREILTEKKILPLLILFLYLQYYPLTCVSYFFRADEFSMFFIFFAFYFYLKENFKFTLVFSTLSIFCREENALVIAVLGIASYFQPKKRKYFLSLILLGILSFIAIRFTMIKILKTPPEGFYFQSHYGYLGKTFLDKLRNIIIHPSLILNNILRNDRITLFKDVFGLVLYLPFLSPNTIL